MSGQMEWMLMFAMGAGAAWLTLKLFGIAPCVVLVGLSVGGLEAETFNIHNSTVTPVFVNACGMVISTDDLGNQTSTYTHSNPNGFGDWCNSASQIINSGSTGTYSYDSTGATYTDLWVSPSDLDSPGTVPHLSINADNAATHNVQVFGNLDNHEEFWKVDGNWVGPSPPGQVINPHDPWFPQNDGTDITNVVISNYYGGIVWTSTVPGGAISAREAGMMAALQDMQAQLSKGLNSQTTNQWNWDGAMYGNFLTTNAGPATALNPWLIGYLPLAGWGGTMSNGIGPINWDVHQWVHWSEATGWMKKVWAVIIFLFTVRTIRGWLYDAQRDALMVPGSHFTQSIGGVFSGLVAGGILAAAIFAIPVAFTAWIETASAGSTDSSLSFAQLYTADGTRFQDWARYAWDFVEEFFPMQTFITMCLYLATLDFFLIPQLRNVQLMIMKFLGLVVLLAAVNCEGAANALFSQSVPGAHRFHYNSSFALVDDGTVQANVQYNFIADGSDGEAYLIFGLVADVNAWGAGTTMGSGILELFTTGGQTLYNGFAAPFFTDDVFPGPVFPFTGTLFEGDIPTTGFRPGSLAQFIYPFRTNYVWTVTTTVHPIITPVLATLFAGNDSSGTLYLQTSSMNGSLAPGVSMLWPSQPSDTNLATGPNGSVAWTNTPGHNYILGCGTNGIPSLQDDPNGKLSVDGVQGFIEGYAMIIPMSILGWVRKFRRIAQSGVTRIDL